MLPGSKIVVPVFAEKHSGCGSKLEAYTVLAERIASGLKWQLVLFMSFKFCHGNCISIHRIKIITYNESVESVTDGRVGVKSKDNAEMP